MNKIVLEIILLNVYIFGFRCLQWRRADVTGASVQCRRTTHTVTCHSSAVSGASTLATNSGELDVVLWRCDSLFCSLLRLTWLILRLTWHTTIILLSYCYHTAYSRIDTLIPLISSLIIIFHGSNIKKYLDNSQVYTHTYFYWFKRNWSYFGIII